MAGILDRLNRNLGQPGMGQALGLLGAHLMAAGAPSFNPGGRAGMIPRGAGAFSDVLRQTSQDAETKRFRDQQIAQMEQVQAERERKSESELAMQRMLLGGQMGGKGAAERSFRGAQDVGTEAVSAPILTDPLLMGMAKANPMAAAAAKLRQDQAETQFGRQKELKGMPLSPGQESQQMRMAGGRAKIKAGLTPQYSGEVKFDEKLGKHYQINPKTFKREYISGAGEGTELAATLQAIKKARAEGNNDLADRLEMQQIFGGKPPEAYVKARSSATMARTGLSKVYSLIEGGTGAILPTDRAKLGQAFEEARLGYAELTNRGANFTDSEQAMIAKVLGGDPTDVLGRALRGDKSYLDLIRKSAQTIESRAQGLLDAYTKPSLGKANYPWEKGGWTTLPNGVRIREKK